MNLTDNIIHIEGPEVTPFAEHDVWFDAAVNITNDLRSLRFMRLASTIEERIAENVEAQLKANTPAKWNLS